LRGTPAAFFSRYLAPYIVCRAHCALFLYIVRAQEGDEMAAARFKRRIHRRLFNIARSAPRAIAHLAACAWRARVQHNVSINHRSNQCGENNGNVMAKKLNENERKL